MESPRFLPLAVKTMICHTLTYVLMGILAMRFMNYAEMLARPNSGMRHLDDPMVMAGPLFQPLRGLVFALVFYPLRERLFGRKDGWLVMAWMLIAIGIISPFAAAAGSLEGMVYSTIPIRGQVVGWLEVVPQALLLSALLCYWVNDPKKKWLNILLGIVFVLVMSLPILGLLAHKKP